MKIHFVKGDATKPQGEGHKYIIHICNDIGGWGSGFVLSLRENWPEAEKSYRSLKKYELGMVDFVEVAHEPHFVYVANMIAQRNVKDDGLGAPPIRYGALARCLEVVKDDITNFRSWMEHTDVIEAPVSIHMPRIGCGLAGGKWEFVMHLIYETFLYDGFCDVYVYDLPGTTFKG